MTESPRLFYLLARAQRRIGREADAAALREIGVTQVQLGALFALAKSDGMSIGGLAEMLDLGPSAASALVERLEAAGLVQREISRADRRSSHLHATALGLAAVARAKPIVARFNRRLTEGFTREEVAVIERFLRAQTDRFSNADPS